MKEKELFFQIYKIRVLPQNLELWGWGLVNNKKLCVLSVSVVNKEAGSWKLGVRIKKQIKNPFKSAFICVLIQDLRFGGWDFVKQQNSFFFSVFSACLFFLCVLCVPISFGGVWDGL